MNEHNQHNEHDEFEAELAALRPIQPTPQLKERIADRLEEQVIPASGLRRFRGPLWVAAICGPLAAVLTFFLLRGGSDRPLAPEHPGVAERPAISTAFDDSLPSLGSYRRAILQSPESLSALLDKHAHNSPETKPERARVYVFARSHSELENLLGEL